MAAKDKAVPGTRITVGLPVAYVLPPGNGINKESVGQVRPGVIVSASRDTVNLQVFMNGDGNKLGDHIGPMLWVQNPPYDETGKAEGSWRLLSEPAGPTG